MRSALEYLRDTALGTAYIVGGLMLFMACIYGGLFLNVAFWHWLASIV
jgi:hypothetical protein